MSILTTPVYTAIDILEDSLKAVLAELVETLDGEAACWWLQAPVPARVVDALRKGTLSAAIVFQSQDAGGKQRNSIGVAGWSGLITIRVYAASAEQARTVAALVPAALATATAPEGYTIGVRWDRPLVLPPSDRIVVAASQWRVEIRRVSSEPTPTPSSALLDFGQANNSYYIPLVF